jgi:hypothetical protein
MEPFLASKRRASLDSTAQLMGFEVLVVNEGPIEED